MKKLFATMLAALIGLSGSVGAFAAQTYSKKLTDLTSQAISEEGVAYAAGDTITPNQVIYFLIPDESAKALGDSRTANLTVRKHLNGKLVKSVKLVEKKLVSGSTTYSLPTGNVVDGKAKYTTVKGKDRHTYIAVTLGDTTSSDEFKVDLTLTFTARKSTGMQVNYQGGKEFQKLGKSDKLALRLTFFVANKLEDGDSATVSVGSKGVTIKPVKNQTNEIMFENGNDNVALLTFKASSNPGKLYARLSTKWTTDLARKFSRTDAVIRSFTPATIDSSSRATLAFYNPFDEDDVDPKKVYIYSVSANGKIVNVTSSFSYDEDEDAFVTKTRTLGTWIISDKKIKIS